MDTDDGGCDEKESCDKETKYPEDFQFSEEMYVYLCNLVTYEIMRRGDFKSASKLSSSVDSYCSNFQSRRTFDILKAKNLTYLFLCNERTFTSQDFAPVLLKKFR